MRLIMLSTLLATPLIIAVLFPALADDKTAGKDKDAARGSEAGWVQLFNGKDLTGWKMHSPPSPQIMEFIPREKDGKVIGYDGKLKGSDKVKDGTVVTLWRVEDGILIGSGPASHLFSERGDYTDFQYRVEAMINDGGNSGQYFRTAFGAGFPRGYEAQINATHSDWRRTGSLYFRDLDEVLIKEAAHKPGEWFTQEVTAEGDHITIKVNGKKTVDWKDPMKRHAKGHFALQGHDPGTVVKFRKIEVKELPPSK